MFIFYTVVLLFFLSHQYNMKVSDVDISIASLFQNPHNDDDHDSFPVSVSKLDQEMNPDLAAAWSISCGLWRMGVPISIPHNKQEKWC